MELSRRNLFGAAAGSIAAAGTAAVARSASAGPAADPAPVPATSLPDRSNFVFDGIHMNAAYTHAVGLPSSQASRRYFDSRMHEVGRNWPVDNPRNRAVALYAVLINAAPGEIAVAPSTLEGENLIAAALDLGPGRGVVTDAFHYDASLVHYGEMARRGMPLTVVAPRGNHIDYDALDAAITPATRLVAVSLVGSATGYRHDLKRLCEIAHAKGAFVYADVIQAVGAVPFDVKASGVDFCCAGHYKWLMGEFGAAFLYVRPDRLKDLHRTQLGWRGVRSYHSHILPTDSPGPAEGDWTLGDDTASLFEVGTPAWGSLAATAGALEYITALGVERIDAWRRPMLERLQIELPRAGFAPLTPRDAQGPAVVFSKPGLRDQVGGSLKAAGIYLTVYKDAVRISPSVHNDMGQVDKVIAALTRS